MSKMLRLIVTTNDYTLAANVGGPHELSQRTFDVPCPDALAAFLAQPTAEKMGYVSRWISGVELREDGHPNA